MIHAFLALLCAPKVHKNRPLAPLAGLCILACTLTLSQVHARPTIDLTPSTSEVVRILEGNNITVVPGSFSQTVGESGQFGTFSNGTSLSGTGPVIGIQEGIFMTTGHGTKNSNSLGYLDSTEYSGTNFRPIPTESIAAANDTPGASTPHGTRHSDPELATIDPGADWDTVILEFQAIPDERYLKIIFAFASEEYPEFVCYFNDSFGFFVREVGTSTWENVAVVPGSSDPISVNTINAGECLGGGSLPAGVLGNSQFYVDNGEGFTGGSRPYDVNQHQNLQFDGLTIPLATNLEVTPGATYDVKLVIADAYDGQVDTAVFIDIIESSRYLIDGDAKLDLTTTSDTVSSGQEVSFTLEASNLGQDAIPGVKVDFSLPSDLTWKRDTSGGAYNVSTGVWTVPGSIGATGGSKSIVITAEAGGSGGDVDLFAEISAMSANDVNSEPGNGAQNPPENDEASLSIMISALDQSDTPTTDKNYGTASHSVVDGIRIGATNTPDPTAYDSVAADEDTGDDGVSFPDTLIQGGTGTISVTVHGTGGYLQGWIDWNGDGDFDDTGERVAGNVRDGGTEDTDSSAGTIGIGVSVPGDAATTPTYSRFRWSTENGIDQTAVASDGEVEDYRLEIQAATTIDNVCNVVNLHFVATSEADLANGALPIATGDAERTYTDVAGLGIDMKVSAFNSASRSSGKAITYSPQFYSIEVPSGAQWHLYIEFFDTGTSIPAYVTDFKFNLEDFESGGSDVEYIENLTIDTTTSTQSLNFNNDVSLSHGAGGSTQISRSGTRLEGSHSSGAWGEDPDRWTQVFINYSERYKTIGFDIGSTGSSSPRISLCHPVVQKPSDYGDAPASYGVNAQHVMQDGMHMGGAPDEDLAGQPSNNADGDDKNNDSDEDGVNFDTFRQAQRADITVEVSGDDGYLQGWIDWNKDGDFDDIGEQVAEDLEDNSFTDTDKRDGNVGMTVRVPETTSAGGVYARFRWSEYQGLDSDSIIIGGEVEDYEVNVLATTFNGCPTEQIGDGSGYATSGTGQYVDSVYWLDWSCPGTPTFKAGEIIRKSWSMGGGIEISGELSNITADLKPHEVTASHPLSALYGGVNPVGLANSSSGQDAEYNFDFTMTFNGSPMDAKIVVTQAEQTGSGESGEWTTDGDPWEVLETSGASMSASFSDDGLILTLQGANSGSGVFLGLSEGASSIGAKMDVGSRDAMGYGFFLPFDFGDVPLGYPNGGGHFIEVDLLGSSRPSTTTLISSLTAASLNETITYYLGTAKPDANGLDANSDPKTGSNDYGKSFR